MRDEPPPIGTWQRMALRSVLPAGFTMLTLWILWVGLSLVNGTATGITWAQAALGLVTSVLLILAGSAYRRVLGE